MEAAAQLVLYILHVYIDVCVGAFWGIVEKRDSEPEIVVL